MQHVSINGEYSLPSSPASPSRGDSDLPIPSLYQFSAADAASAADYSNDPGVEDGVVNSPPAKVCGGAYAPTPSPLRGGKRMRLTGGGMSPREGSAPKCPKSSRRLCMDPTILQPAVILDVPTIAVISVDASVAPAKAMLAPGFVRPEPPIAKVVNLTRSNVLVSFHIGIAFLHPPLLSANARPKPTLH